MNQEPDHETIFVQTDPAFNLVLQSLRELKDQDRVQVMYMQAAELNNIESNDADENRRLRFGGTRQPYLAFGRTASGVVRMCMLEAAGVKRKFFPRLSGKSDSRNRANLRNPLGDGPRCFHLTNDYDRARHYWSRYDQLYPHFRIEDEVREVALNTQVSIPSMMLIFREYRDFSVVVEITTTFDATPREEQQFHSYIHVICIVRKITKEGEDGTFTRQLKELMVPVFEMRREYLETMKKVKKETDLPQLHDAFAKLKVGDKNE